MDDPSYIPVNSDLNIGIDGDNWSAELKIEDISILVSLANPNNLSQPDNFSVKLEKKLYEDAATKDLMKESNKTSDSNVIQKLKSDFMSRICQKIMPMESLYYHGSSAASSSSDLVQTTRTETAGHGSSLQNMSAYSHEPVGNLVGPSTQSSIFANIHRESPRSQPLQQVVPQLQHQQLRQQLFKQKVQQPHIQPSLMQPNIQYSHHQQQDQQILSLPIELQYSQQPMFTTVQDQQQTGQRQNATILQQNHHVGLLEKKQQLPSYQQNMSTPFNHNVSGLQQQKQFIGARSDMLKRQPHQHALNVLQQPEVAAPQQSVHQTTQPMQLHQLMGLQDQRNSLQESMQKRHHNSVALLPQNGFIDQQKQTEQSQRVLPQASSASLDSTCQIECAALADWHDQGYRESQNLKNCHPRNRCHQPTTTYHPPSSTAGEGLQVSKCLNVEFDPVWSRVLGVDVLPSLQEAFAYVQNEESRHSAMLPLVIGDRSSLVYAPSRDVTGKDTIFCDYCRKLRHTRETCWKLHRAPSRSRGDWSSTRGSRSDQSRGHGSNPRAHQFGAVDTLDYTSSSIGPTSDSLSSMTSPELEDVLCHLLACRSSTAPSASSSSFACLAIDRGNYQRLVSKFIYLSHSRLDIAIAVSMEIYIRILYLHRQQSCYLEEEGNKMWWLDRVQKLSLELWHELESVRDMYLTEVIRFYKRIRELCLQPPSAELATKYEKTRIFMEKTIKFLEMPRADIVRCSKDKFYHYLKLIIILSRTLFLHSSMGNNCNMAVSLKYLSCSNK
ncbi:hypothetical protein HYC85_015861 [Camellia sinensis]|uniref:Uncharacterized protein n=1 Tax=Camellia sinensis TaxID=4442 RepID=A0A7J7GXX4_CAMSI|nr:hypothetical protein HYC85_015861 [Camellia sinensis]